MLIVAVTGGIGSGKSTVSNRLGACGALIVDSDQVAREVVSPGSEGLRLIADRFGQSLISPDGMLDRAALAAIVFGDADARMALNSITHPLIRRRFAEVVASAPSDAVIVNDIPILTTLEAAAEFALVIGVGAATQVRVSRLIGRGLTENDARARMAAQISDDERRLLADGWLDNNGSAQELLAQVDELWAGRLTVMNFNVMLGRPAAVVGSPAVIGSPAVAGSPAAALTEARIRAAARRAGRSVVSVEAQDAHFSVKVSGGLNPSGVGSDDPAGDSMVEAMGRAGFVPSACGVYRGADPLHAVTITLAMGP